MVTVMGNKIVPISRFHVTELCFVGKFPLYVWIVISSAVVGDESNVCIIAVTACWVICQKTSDFYESPNLSGVVILWADLESGAGRISECFWAVLKWSSSFLFLLHKIHPISWAKKCCYSLTETTAREVSVCMLFEVKFGFWGSLTRQEVSPKKIWKQLILFLKQNTSTPQGKGHISHSWGETPKW